MFFYLTEFNPSLWIGYEYFVAKIPQSHVDQFIILGLTFVNIFVNFLSTLTLERSLATADFAHEHAKCPNVNLIPVAIGIP